VSEGTVPVDYLDEEGEEKPRKMKNLHGHNLSSKKTAQEQKHYPEEVDNDNGICKNSVNHFFEKIPEKISCYFTETELY